MPRTQKPANKRNVPGRDGTLAVFVLEPGAREHSERYQDYANVLEDNGGWHDGWEMTVGRGVENFYWWAYVPKRRVAVAIDELRSLGFDATTTYPD